MATDRMRDEAERLVAAAIATISSAARGFGTTNRNGAGLATGSAECCICPVCKAIAAMRDPSGDLAERLASGVGDLATAASSILRTLATRGGRTESEPEPEPAPTAEGDEFWESLRRQAADAAKSHAHPSPATEPTASTMDDDPWRVATSTDVPHQGVAPEPPATPEPLATAVPPVKKVVKKAVKKAAPPPVEPPPAKKVAKKAVAKKALKKAAPPAA